MSGSTKIESRRYLHADQPCEGLPRRFTIRDICLGAADRRRRAQRRAKVLAQILVWASVALMVGLACLLLHRAIGGAR
jgi:hypothetical protein